MAVNTLRVLLIGFLISRGDAANILFVTIADSGSHLRLANHGHHVHVLVPFDQLPQAETANVTFTTTPVVKFKTATDFYWNNYVTSFSIQRSFSQEDPVFQQILDKYQNKLDDLMKINWDVIVADILFNPHGYGIIDRHGEERGTPYILYETACDFMPWISVEMGWNWNPVTHAYMFEEAPATVDNFKKSFDPSSFIDRISAFSQTANEYIGFHFKRSAYHMGTVESFGAINFGWKKLFTSAAFIMTEKIFSYGWQTPVTNTLINIGSHCKRAQAVSEELEQFISSRNAKGLIYVALGTYTKLDEAPPHFIESLLHLFRYHKTYNFLMVTQTANGLTSNDETLENVKFVKWAPQLDILAHKHTKLFISHGGLKSTKEAICSAVPLVVIPLYAEQPLTADEVIRSGIGVSLHKRLINGPSLIKAVNLVLTNPAYKIAVARLSEIHSDTIITALDLATFNVEKAIRTKGKVSHPYKAVDITWSAFLHIDFAIALFATVYGLSNIV